jgi:hypothetical protein
MRKALTFCHSTWLTPIKVTGCSACSRKNYASMSLLTLTKTKVPHMNDENITSFVINQLIWQEESKLSWLE